jgi:hypothetical protein
MKKTFLTIAAAAVLLYTSCEIDPWLIHGQAFRNANRQYRRWILWGA